MSLSVGMMKFPIYGKIKLMFQTTNQLYIIYPEKCPIISYDYPMTRSKTLQGGAFPDMFVGS